MSKPVLVLYPARVLRRECEEADPSEEFARTLLEASDAFGGVGLAANQIGVSVRAFAITTEDTRIAVFNPRIVRESGRSVSVEGCLSCPKLAVPIERSSRVTLAFQDESGKSVERTFTGLEAFVVQHELDHLNGKLILDRAGYALRHLYEKKMRKVSRKLKKLKERSIHEFSKE